MADVAKRMVAMLAPEPARTARVQGLSLREIARHLGISRNTVRKYARSLTQPTNRPHNHGVRPPAELAANRSD